MQTKKIIGIALCAALVSSMAAISVSARDTMDDGEGKTYFDGDTMYYTIGVTEDDQTKFIFERQKDQHPSDRQSQWIIQIKSRSFTVDF